MKTRTRMLERNSFRSTRWQSTLSSVTYGDNVICSVRNLVTLSGTAKLTLQSVIAT